MKKVVIIGCFFTVFLLMMIPNVHAIQYKKVTEIVNHKSIQTMYSDLSVSFINSLIDLIIEILTFIFDSFEGILAGLTFIILTANNYNFDSLIYKVLYLLSRINLFIGESLINFLTIISSLFPIQKLNRVNAPVSKDILL